MTNPEVRTSVFSQDALAVVLGNAMFPHSPDAPITRENLPDLPDDLRECLFSMADAAMEYLAACFNANGQAAEIVRVPPASGRQQ